MTVLHVVVGRGIFDSLVHYILAAVLVTVLLRRRSAGGRVRVVRYTLLRLVRFRACVF